jgi:hypothetical protein
VTALVLDLPAEVVVHTPPRGALPVEVLLQGVWPHPPGGGAPLTIVVGQGRLDVDAGQPVLAALHAWAVARTSAAGQVEVISTPLGAAVAAADVAVADAGDGHATVAIAEVLLPIGAVVIMLTLVAPAPSCLPTIAAVAADIASRWRLRSGAR